MYCVWVLVIIVLIRVWLVWCEIGCVFSVMVCRCIGVVML